jgi:hypothetical protein
MELHYVYVRNTQPPLRYVPCERVAVADGFWLYRYIPRYGRFIDDGYAPDLNQLRLILMQRHDPGISVRVHRRQDAWRICACSSTEECESYDAFSTFTTQLLHILKGRSYMNLCVHSLRAGAVTPSILGAYNSAVYGVVDHRCFEPHLKCLYHGVTNSGVGIDLFEV